MFSSGTAARRPSSTCTATASHRSIGGLPSNGSPRLASGIRAGPAGLRRFGGRGRPIHDGSLCGRARGFVTSRALDPVVLVGGSMGGVVAQHFALRHPRLVSRLLLVATGAYTAEPAGALAKADAVASSPWSCATVSPIVEGFFYRRPPDDDIEAFSDHRAPRLPGGGGRRRALEREFANARPACVHRRSDLDHSGAA